MERNGSDSKFTAEQEQLIREHLPLVNWGVSEIAGRVPRFVPRDDLESAAMFGLYQAARTYDADRGVPFGSNLEPTPIYQAMLDAFNAAPKR